MQQLSTANPAEAGLKKNADALTLYYMRQPRLPPCKCRSRPTLDSESSDLVMTVAVAVGLM